MPEILTLMTGLVIVVISIYGVTKSRDPLFPLTILAPMMLYVYVYSPLMRLTTGSLQSIYPDTSRLVPVHIVNLLGATAFCAGCLWYHRSPSIDNRFSVLHRQLPRATRRRMASLAITLGLLSCASFAFMVYYSGGWFRVFANAKPYLRAPSGYIGEMPMLSYPAVFILAFAYQGRRFTVGRILALVMVMLPQIIMATLGGRRGPMFLVSCSFFGIWCIIKQRRPRVKSVVVGLGLVGCLMLLLQGNRGELFRPWSDDLDTSVLEQLWSSPDVNVGDEYVIACANILVSSDYSHHYWGGRYVTQFLIRPIPKFIWPTKYEDVGMEWMVTDPGRSGIASSQWLDSVGFEPAGGSAGGFISDLFLEFSWGCILVCYLLGVMFSVAWKRWVTRGDLWTLLYFEFMILSVYLIVQSLGAWLYRVILVVVLTTVFWRWNIGRRRSQQKGTPRQTSPVPSRRFESASQGPRP